MQCTQEQLDEGARILKRSRSLAVSTGAGISKESGIPTFRDAQTGLWANYNPQELATPQGFSGNPKLVWEWYVERRRMISDVSPNPGHYALVDLEKEFDEFTLITQNIDNLHRKAGSKNIVELHGNILRFKCFDREHPIEQLPDDDRIPPRCHCGSMIRPDVVWFGEILPADAVMKAGRALETCETLLVVGTSGVVYPAAAFPAQAKACGARVIEVNTEISAITPLVDVYLQGPAGEVLPKLVETFRAL
ncbi:MAG: NAD-dependent protein deacylase [Candidatus Latescibacteria bacterium]|nr:NAD-dependent protein deacylase [Candidatus Latescibacterota bacterium]NIM66526.1 NAD-dependent protein deacylase [Candidatus Latescibacterota bacterium]NIO03006.1 NAD-dependent protein deacylase [Candidatus Latescibacterota bacterium]NIO30141.1 NAD-dependent protein deacylase [Candidatus Latescibacterota bacterium]NIO57760.1 NAD-dependent protein deacylase [Candidatus Latescibacterota bacterium]